jgi:UDPglucose 6-dehydrogenase
MRIAMIGAGYVGLVSGACLADFGHEVTCIDSDAEKITALNHGEIPIYEPGLDQLVKDNVAAARLFFSTDLAAAVGNSDVVFIAVGTPPRPSDGHADLSYVYAVAREVAGALKGFTVVATKSTVPLGTGDEIERIIREINPAADVAVVSNPEFLREGSAIGDFKKPDRIVIGLSDDRARTVMAEVYRPFYVNHAPLLFTARRSAELIKYAANAFLALKVSFINEMADFCEVAGVDVQDVSYGIGLDRRIGSRFLRAGPGYGGSCFPKDSIALAKTARDYGSPLCLVETTVAINDDRKRSMARKVVAACGGNVHNKTIAILGLTFKPNTDDMREAPSLSIIQALKDEGAILRVYDPAGMAAARTLLQDVHFADSIHDAATGAHALVIVTEWEVFGTLEFRKLAAAMHTRTLVDLRNVYDPDDVTSQGFAYFGIGRSTSSKELKHAAQ